jgi:hypothetical protein
MPVITYEEIIGQKTLILGDINTGKTTLTADVLKELCGRGLADSIAVIDMAPEIPGELAAGKGLRGVGGKLLPPGGCKVLYLTGRFVAPRLSSKTEEEAMEKARRNRRIVGRLFSRLNRSPKEILLVNDISMAVQTGTSAGLIRALERSPTVVANGYWGDRLGGGPLTVREKSEMTRLKEYFEQKGRVLILEERFHPLAEKI